jgi:hypothetical protein
MQTTRPTYASILKLRRFAARPVRSTGLLHIPSVLDIPAISGGVYMGRHTVGHSPPEAILEFGSGISGGFDAHERHSHHAVEYHRAEHHSVHSLRSHTARYL